MAEILEGFFVESNEIIDQVGRDLLELEKTPSDVELLNRIFRGIHTLKGTSSFLGFASMAELAHGFEDLLNKLRKGTAVATPEMMDVIFEAYDTTKELLGRIHAKKEQGMDLSGIIEKLQAQTVTAPAYQPLKELEVPTTGATDPLQEAVAAQTRLADTTIRVDVNRLDDLMNLVGELVLGRNRLSQVASKLVEEFEEVPAMKELQDANSQIDFVTTELQMAVMKTRMLPIAKVFNKLPRLVRDLARETSKEVDLQVYGKETELDKSIIEELNDPLIHIIRNCVDHGIESADERIRERKPRVGTIVVNAEHEGNHIVISIEDDGRGIDAELLKRKGVEKGLISESQAGEMSKREAFNLIFVAGFSTASKVTSVSGRGVGMDIVRNNVSKLKGIVDIESEVGKGTIITIKLPLTLAIIQALLTKAGSDIFAIPLASVQEVVRLEASEISTVNGRGVIRLRDSVLPLARMAEVMGLPESDASNRWFYIVVVSWADQRIGIVVDSLLGQREVVIKSLGDYLSNIPAIAGSTILGDGRTILIIDTGQFIQLCTRMEHQTTQLSIAAA
ncbi:MAG TPA: chemotaxis protein CheA [Bacteroidetes bacterium]|nr:chemotaxis protein CheA [Bacteroidota bacterium]